MIIACVAMALASGAVPGPSIQQDDAPTVYIRIDQDGGLPAAQLSEALHQMQQIWRAAGVTVTRGMYGEPLGYGDATVSLRILRTAVHRINGGIVLAWVSLTDTGRPAPVLFVSLEGIKELLGPVDFRGRRISQRPQSIQNRLIAMTVGRAAAHELGHFLRGEGQHTTEGLMRPRYRTSDLISDSLEPFQVPAAARVAVRRGVTRLAQSQAGVQ